MDLQIIWLIVLLLLSGFFSGAEVALVGLSRIRARQMSEKNLRGASYIQRLKENPQRMLSTILIGNNLANVGASALLTAVVIQKYDNYAVGIATGIMTFLILIFGEITPKSIAASHNQNISRYVAPPIWYMSVFLYPAIYFLEGLLNNINRVIKPKSGVRAITEDDIRTMVHVAQEEGSIKAFEKNLIINIFEFDETNVSDIVIPRSKVVMVQQNKNLKQAFALMQKNNFARLPVFNKNTDDIVGVIYLKDIIQFNETKKAKTKVFKVMKEPYFVPESKNIGKLLRKFQKLKTQMAIVVDEHGAVEGIVTLEDVLEEIVGDIQDETEKILQNIKKTGRATWMVSGQTEIEEINEKIPIDIKEGNYQTISGFFLENLERIPEKGDSITYGRFTITVERIDGNRIDKLKIKK